MSTHAARADTEEVAVALLGRDRELAKLYALVDGIEEQGGALVVRGEAGIGKSALLAAAKERALHRRVTVVSTTGALSEAQLGFAGLHQLLLPLLGGADLLPDHLRQRILEEAAGNPLALLELPAAAAELGTGVARSAPLPLTARLEHTFASRLAGRRRPKPKHMRRC
jgi:hypothetical protein